MRVEDIEAAKIVERLEIVFQGWYDCRAEGGGERGKGGDGLSEVRQISVSGRGTRGWLSTGGGPVRGVRRRAR